MHCKLCKKVEKKKPLGRPCVQHFLSPELKMERLSGNNCASDRDKDFIICTSIHPFINLSVKQLFHQSSFVLHISVASSYSLLIWFVMLCLWNSWGQGLVLSILPLVKSSSHKSRFVVFWVFLFVICSQVKDEFVLGLLLVASRFVIEMGLPKCIDLTPQLAHDVIMMLYWHWCDVVRSQVEVHTTSFRHHEPAGPWAVFRQNTVYYCSFHVLKTLLTDLIL